MATKRRFTAELETIVRDLAATLARMGATATRAESGSKLSKEAIRQFQRSGVVAEGSVLALIPAGGRISFVRAGERYEFACDTYPHALDNLRAAQRAITLLYQVFEEYGVTRGEASGDQFRRLFGGFLALGDGGAPPWHQVLGVPPDADRATIEAAHRLQARLNHPDKGGVTAAMARINAARDEGLRQLAAGR